MSLPPNREHRVWWIWPRQEPAQREQFKGKTFYFAAMKAEVHFQLQRNQLEFVLCDPSEIQDAFRIEDGVSPPKKIDAWQQLGPKKPYPKKKTKRKKR